SSHGDRERTGGGTGRGILEHAAGWREHARLPASPGAGETVHRDLSQRGQGREIWSERGNGFLALQLDVDVKRAVRIGLDGKSRALNTERPEQLLLALVGTPVRDRLLHAPEDDASGLALQGDRDHAQSRPQLHGAGTERFR